MTSQLQNKREFDKCFEIILKITISKILSHGMGRVMANYTTARLVAEWWRGEWPSGGEVNGRVTYTVFVR